MLAFGLCLFLLDFQELRGDEAFGYFFSQRTYSAIIEETLALQEPHPVASYFVQKAWLDWTQHDQLYSEFLLRFISIWFSTVAVALLYRLARRLSMNSSTALLGTMFLALSPYAIWHAQDARMYSMSLALTLASTLLALRFIERESGRDFKIWVAYIAVSWLALHTHYFAAFVIVAQNLFLFFFALSSVTEKPSFLKKFGFLMPWLVTQVLLASFYLPWLLQAWKTLTDYNGNGESPPWFEMAWRSFSVFAVGESLPDAQRLIWGIFSIAMILSGTLWLLSSSRWGINGTRMNADERGYSEKPASIHLYPPLNPVAILLCYLWIPLLITWFSATSRPIFDERYLMAVAPPFYLLLATILAALWNQRHKLTYGLSLLLFCIILSGSLLSMYNHYYNLSYSKTRGWRELANSMNMLSAAIPLEEVRLIQNYPDPTLWYYYHGPVPHLVLPPAPNDLQATEREVNALNEAGVERVILAEQFSPGWDANGIALQTLSQQYEPIGTIEIGSWQVITLVQPPNVWSGSSVLFENGVSLEQWSLTPTQVVANGLLAVHLVWRLDEASLNGSEKVFIHLVDENGALVAQNDAPFGLLDGEVIELVKVYGIEIPAALEAATKYRLLVGLYDPSLAGAPRIMTIDGADSFLIDVNETTE